MGFDTSLSLTKFIIYVHQKLIGDVGERESYIEKMLRKCEKKMNTIKKNEKMTICDDLELY